MFNIKLFIKLFSVHFCHQLKKLQDKDFVLLFFFFISIKSPLKCEDKQLLLLLKLCNSQLFINVHYLFICLLSKCHKIVIKGLSKFPVANLCFFSSWNHRKCGILMWKLTQTSYSIFYTAPFLQLHLAWLLYHLPCPLLYYMRCLSC